MNESIRLNQSVVSNSKFRSASQKNKDAVSAAFKKTAKCTHQIEKHVNGERVISTCKSIAIKDYPFCPHHIRFHPQDYEKFLREQAIIVNKETGLVLPSRDKQSKYNFLKKEFKDSFKEFYSHEGLVDLKNEIALLSASLNRLYAMNLDNTNNLKIIDTQLKIINQIRLLIKTMRELDEGKKYNISFNDLKIFMVNVAQVIKNYISDGRTLESIGKEVLDIYHARKAELDGNGNQQSKKFFGLDGIQGEDGAEAAERYEPEGVGMS